MPPAIAKALHNEAVHMWSRESGKDTPTSIPHMCPQSPPCACSNAMRCDRKPPQQMPTAPIPPTLLRVCSLGTRERRSARDGSGVGAAKTSPHQQDHTTQDPTNTDPPPGGLAASLVAATVAPAALAAPLPQSPPLTRVCPSSPRHSASANTAATRPEGW